MISYLLLFLGVPETVVFAKSVDMAAIDLRERKLRLIILVAYFYFSGEVVLGSGSDTAGSNNCISVKVFKDSSLRFFLTSNARVTLLWSVFYFAFS